MNLCKTDSMSVVLDDRDAFYISEVFILKKKTVWGWGGKSKRTREDVKIMYDFDDVYQYVQHIDCFLLSRNYNVVFFCHC